MKEKTIEYFKKYGYPNDESEVSPKTQEDIKALNLFRKLLDVKLLCRMDEECIKNELDDYFSRNISANNKIETQKPIIRNLRITNNEIPYIQDIESQYQRDLDFYQLIDNRNMSFAGQPDFGNNDDWCEFIFSLVFSFLLDYC